MGHSTPTERGRDTRKWEVENERTHGSRLSVVGTFGVNKEGMSHDPRTVRVTFIRERVGNPDTHDKVEVEGPSSHSEPLHLSRGTDPSLTFVLNSGLDSFNSLVRCRHREGRGLTPSGTGVPTIRTNLLSWDKYFFRPLPDSTTFHFLKWTTTPTSPRPSPVAPDTRLEGNLLQTPS